MDLLKLSGTCSMGELTNVYTEDLNSSSEFLREVNILNTPAGQNISYFNPFCFIIHNSILKKPYRDIIKNAGFKLISRYKGDEGTVYTYMMRIKNPT